jgi:hypothetical protein
MRFLRISVTVAIKCSAAGIATNNQRGKQRYGFDVGRLRLCGWYGDRITENVGCRFIVANAKSEAVSFYEKQGFVLLDSEGNQSTEHHLMFLDLVGLA